MPRIPISEWFLWWRSLLQAPSLARSTFFPSLLLHNQNRTLFSPSLPSIETSCHRISCADLIPFTSNTYQPLMRICREDSKTMKIPTMPLSLSAMRIGPLPTRFGPHNSAESVKTSCSRSATSLRARGFCATHPSVVRMFAWSRPHSSNRRAAPSTSPLQNAA